MYRAVPENVSTINEGDWVTTSRKYADLHGERTLDGNYKIIEQKAKAGDLLSEGYPYEFGYRPSDLAALTVRTQTETPEFKNFFGDSKVVGADGQPLVVYHGTDATDIKNFKHQSTQASFFTDSAQVADGYAMDRSQGYFVGSGPLREGPFPTRREALDFKNSEGGGKVVKAGEAVSYPVYLSIKNPLIVDAKGKGWNQIKYPGISSDDSGYWYISRDIRQKHDGIILKNVQDNTGASEGVISNTYIAFKPNQIKSAIGNEGTFDPANPVITKAHGGEASSAKIMLDRLTSASANKTH
jgi:hypothetical protein